MNIPTAFARLIMGVLYCYALVLNAFNAVMLKIVTFNFPKILYIVYNKEDYVGSFFQAAFYDPISAFQYMGDTLWEEKAKKAQDKMELEGVGMWDEDFDKLRSGYNMYVVAYDMVKHQPIARMREDFDINTGMGFLRYETEEERVQRETEEWRSFS